MGDTTWKAFWKDRDRPLHAEDTDEFYEAYAEEVKAVLRGPSRKTLEIGCGTGSLYPYLSEAFGDYTGIDFSERMLAVFGERYPRARLICADGSTFRDDGSYDLIFCNGVVQNFSDQMVRELLENCGRMLAPGGRVFIGMIPDRRLRLHFVSGYLRHRPRSSPAWKTCIRCCIEAVLRRNNFGRWFDAVEFMRLASDCGYCCSILGSLLYRYRFHALLKREGVRDAGRESGQ